MKYPKSFPAFTALIFAILLCGCEDDLASSQQKGPVTIQFNLEDDSSYQYILDSKLSLQPEINGKTLNITQEMKLLSKYKVTHTGPNYKNLTVTYTRITMRSGNGITVNEYDSYDTANKNPMFASIGAMMNKPFNMMVSANGVSSINTFYDTDNTDTTAIAYGDSSLRKTMIQCLKVYPDKPVSPGDSWKHNFQTSNGFIHMRVENTYTLKSLDEGIAHIELKGQITPEDSTQAMVFSGVQSGGIDIDIKTGLITISKITQQLTGKISLGGKSNAVSATSEINIIGNKL